MIINSTNYTRSHRFDITSLVLLAVDVDTVLRRMSSVPSVKFCFYFNYISIQRC